MQPINYLTQVADPFAQSLQGFQLGSGIVEIQQKQALAEQQRQQQQQQQQLAAQEQARFFAKPNPTMRDALQFAAVLPKDRADALRPYIENFSKAQQQSVLKTNGQILSALQVNPETGIKLLKDFATAQRNSGDEEEALLYERIAEAAADPTRGPSMAFKSLVTVTSRIPGAKEMFESIDKASSTARTEELAPAALKKAVADADKAIADANIRIAEAANVEDRLKAEQDLRLAQIEKEQALTAASVGGEGRAAGLAESVLGKSVADAEKAVADAQISQANATNAKAKSDAEAALAIALADKGVADAKVAQANAKNAPEKAAAEAKRATAEAQKATVEAKYAEQIQIAGLNKTNWDIKNLQSQIKDRSEKLNLDRQKTQADVADKLSAIQQRLTDIPESARKLINESATQSATSKQAAIQYNDLASRIESAQGGKGRLTSASEWFASQLGNQDAWTQIRNEYTRVRNSVAIKSLPPGASTDADIQLALKGIPPENANAATLASFLRGSAKLQDIDSAINNSKTDWLSQNNGLLTRAKSTFIAGDYATKSGETFNDFAQRIVGDVAKKYRSPEQLEKERVQELASRIPTNQASTVVPAATPVDTRSRADAILRGGK